MYQMLIVEDRYELRQSLCHYIPWETIGFTVSADFGEADKALAYLMSNPSVDVVLCDILMPVMSGMDLAREIHERKIPCKIVFLSAYKEFEYAKQAMRYGVARGVFSNEAGLGSASMAHATANVQHRFLRFCQHLTRLLDFGMWESHFVFNSGEPRFQIAAG